MLKKGICGVCGTDKSVKYILNSNRNGLTILCCNKCILKFIFFDIDILEE